MINYKLKRRKGYDDLVCAYAFIGNSQGDESATNNIGDYLNSKGWLSYTFSKDININDQEAIDKESIRRKEQNIRYIQSLKDNGTYGEEYEIDLFLNKNPLFDDPTAPSKETYRFVILDFNKDK